MRSCHITGPACISTINLCTTHTVCIHFGLSCTLCECSQKTACYCTCPGTRKCPSCIWGVQWLSLSLLVSCVCEDFLKVQGPSSHYQLHVHPLSSPCKSCLRIAIPSLPLYAFMLYTGTALALNLPLSVFTKFFVTESRFDCHNFITT
jgi:hypothetical protein